MSWERENSVSISRIITDFDWDFRLIPSLGKKYRKSLFYIRQILTCIIFIFGVSELTMHQSTSYSFCWVRDRIGGCPVVPPTLPLQKITKVQQVVTCPDSWLYTVYSPVYSCTRRGSLLWWTRRIWRTEEKRGILSYMSLTMGLAIGLSEYHLVHNGAPPWCSG